MDSTTVIIIIVIAFFVLILIGIGAYFLFFQSTGCTKDADCSSGKVCSNGKCVTPTKCTTDANCSGTNKKCKTSDGICVQCLTDTDCSSGFACQDNRCVSPFTVETSCNFAAGLQYPFPGFPLVTITYEWNSRSEVLTNQRAFSSALTIRPGPLTIKISWPGYFPTSRYTTPRLEVNGIFSKQPISSMLTPSGGEISISDVIDQNGTVIITSNAT